MRTEYGSGNDTIATICLHAEGAVLTAEKSEVPKAYGGSETILLVDDDLNVLEILKVLLKSLGYAVLGWTNGQEALDLYRENKDCIDLVILDMVMLGLSGSDIFERIKELSPSAKLIVMTGYDMNSKIQQIIDKGCCGFIQKPFDVTQISRKIRDVLDH
jgi:two-component system, cell cycle sensor histidine kinase and response regulator CckA